MNAFLKEKELLLQEIYHRVKNNMQVICSLFKLRSDSIEDGYPGNTFDEYQNRVRAMSLVHEELSQPKDLSHVPFKGFLQSLICSPHPAYARNNEISSETEGICFDMATAIACCPRIHELLSCSLKHAVYGKGK